MHVLVQINYRNDIRITLD
uniref:Uncharacterized protein n=1 Tax=Musa acuminata subsp. malaccensis TaxID=214687 RepID=A0A804IPE4_MUSAM